MGAHQRRIAFGETRPVSTYQLTFAAGPFRKPDDGSKGGSKDGAGLPGLYVRQSMLKRAEAEAPEVQQIAARGFAYLTDYFGQPFPFPKYDMVLIPGFPYGGMEHAGATFLREASVHFRRAHGSMSRQASGSATRNEPRALDHLHVAASTPSPARTGFNSV